MCYTTNPNYSQPKNFIGGEGWSSPSVAPKEGEHTSQQLCLKNL